MKKIYFAPKCDMVNVQVTEMLAGSKLPSGGGNATDIFPGDGEYDGEFQSNINNGIW